MYVDLDRDDHMDKLTERVLRGVSNREARKLARTPLLLEGGGPWRISDECSATLHNTPTASQGRARPGEVCVCPRSVALLRERRAAELKRRHELRDQRKQRGERKPRFVRQASYYTNVVTRVTPILEGALCNSVMGRKIVDEALSDGRSAMALIEMCRRCPARKACGDWAVNGERKAGDWGAIYGGMGESARRAEKKRRMGKEDESR